MATSSPSLPPLEHASHHQTVTSSAYPSLPSSEHQQLFDFAFEHFSGGKWQRAHHRRLRAARLQQQQRDEEARRAGGGVEGEAAFAGRGTLSSSAVPSSAANALGPADDDTPVLDLAALSSLLLGVGCVVGTAEELSVAVGALPPPPPPSSPQAVYGHSHSNGAQLSYRQTLQLAASLPTVVPQGLQARRGRRDGSGPSPSAAAAEASEASFAARLPQIMEAIRLFVMFQKGHLLPLQALRTVLSTMGDEPLSQGELDYLLHPLQRQRQREGERGGGSANDGITLLQFLELFQLI